jgi:hypothetical protein
MDPNMAIVVAAATMHYLCLRPRNGFCGPQITCVLMDQPNTGLRLHSVFFKKDSQGTLGLHEQNHSSELTSVRICDDFSSVDMGDGQFDTNEDPCFRFYTIVVGDMDMDHIFNQHTDHVTIKVDVQMEIMWDDVATY